MRIKFVCGRVTSALSQAGRTSPCILSNQTRERLFRQHLRVVIKTSLCKEIIIHHDIQHGIYDDHPRRHPSPTTTKKCYKSHFRQHENTQRVVVHAIVSTQRVLVFAFRQRPNTQRAVVRMIATRQEQAEDPRRSQTDFADKPIPTIKARSCVTCANFR